MVKKKRGTARDTPLVPEVAEIALSTYLPIPIYPAGKKSLFPSQQQLLNSRNRKSKRPHSQKMGWGNFRATYPHKKRKMKTRGWRRHHLGLEIPTPSLFPLALFDRFL
jgi:hypothetical protein